MNTVPYSYYRTTLILLGIIILTCIATVIAPPAGRFSWLLEVGPGLAGIAVLLATHRRDSDTQLLGIANAIGSTKSIDLEKSGKVKIWNSGVKYRDIILTTFWDTQIK